MKKRYGLLIPKKLNPKDYKFGGVTGVPKDVVKLNGQYDEFIPESELQYGTYTDTMACVTFSALNNLEILLAAKFNLHYNFSDRFIAKKSGTTHSGNYLNAVAETIRTSGLVDEALWPFDRTNAGMFTWDKYYEPLPDEVQAKALQFLNDFEIKWEWVYDDIQTALKYGPLQVTILYSGSEKADANGIIPRVEGTPNHAVTLYGYEDGQYWKIYDHYEQVKKKLAWDYFIDSKLRYFITKKTFTIPPMITIANNTLVQDVEGSGTFGLFLDNKIYIDDLAKILATFEMRNNGKTDSKVRALTKKDWESFPKYDLKNNLISLT